MTIVGMTTILKNTMSPRRSLSSSSSSQSLFLQLLFVVSMILGITTRNTVTGLSISSLATSHHSKAGTASSSFSSRLGATDSATGGVDVDGDDDEREREFVRVRRRRGRGGYDDEDGYEYDDDDRRSDNSVMDAVDMLEDGGFFDDLDDEYDEDDESYDMFSNTVIPNPILDSIDPDGAADRFPELAADPRFWLDMFLFIAFLNFVSFIGPRNPFPDVIPAMYTAGLPPPGL